MFRGGRGKILTLLGVAIEATGWTPVEAQYLQRKRPLTLSPANIGMARFQTSATTVRASSPEAFHRLVIERAVLAELLHVGPAYLFGKARMCAGAARS